MAVVEVKIPQMGEGLEQVFIIKFFKEEGDSIEKDEALYEMETDKSTVSIESSYNGVVKEWLAKKGSVMNVDDPIVRIEIEEEIAIDSQEHLSPSLNRKLSSIPPRTRSYCLKHGISEEIMLQIPSAADTLMPSDIDAYLDKS